MANAIKEENDQISYVSNEMPTETPRKKSKNFYFWRTVLISSMCAFSCGMGTNCTVPITPKIKSEKRLNENPFGKVLTLKQRGWISACYYIGAITGPPFAAFAVNKIGRKTTLMCCVGIPFFLSFLIFSFSELVFLYYIGRFIGGFALGNSFVTLPMYLGEISDVSVRGRVLSLISVFMCSGNLFTFSVGPHLSIPAFTFLCSLVPATFFILFSGYSDTPYYYLSRGKVSQAEMALMKLRNATQEEVKEELKSLQDVIEKERGENKTLPQLCKSLRVTKEFFMTMGLAFFQQCTGLALEGSTLNAVSEKLSGVLIGGLQVTASILTPFIIDSSGRKLLLFISAMGMMLSDFGQGLYFFSKTNNMKHGYQGSWLGIVSVIVYQLSYYMGFGPVTWVIVGEIFPPKIKPIAIMATVMFCWSIFGLQNLFLPTIDREFGEDNLSWIYALVCIVAVLFVQLFVIETKNMRLGRIKEEQNG